jgi:hypothetical protein
MHVLQSLTQSIDKVARVIVCDGGSTEAQCVESLHELERQDNVQVMHLPAQDLIKRG